MAEKFCFSCGAKISEKCKFCPKCGEDQTRASVDSTPEQTAQAAAPVTPASVPPAAPVNPAPTLDSIAPMAQPAAKKSGKAKIALIVIGIVIAVALVVLILVLVFKDDDSSGGSGKKGSSSNVTPYATLNGETVGNCQATYTYMDQYGTVLIISGTYQNGSVAVGVALDSSLCKSGSTLTQNTVTSTSFFDALVTVNGSQYEYTTSTNPSAFGDCSFELESFEENSKATFTVDVNVVIADTDYHFEGGATASYQGSDANTQGGQTYDDYDYNAGGDYNTDGAAGSRMCGACYGSGVCSVCDGSGLTRYFDGSDVTCNSCHGGGRCKACNGMGYY